MTESLTLTYSQVCWLEFQGPQVHRELSRHLNPAMLSVGFLSLPIVRTRWTGAYWLIVWVSDCATLLGNLLPKGHLSATKSRLVMLILHRDDTHTSKCANNCSDPKVRLCDFVTSCQLSGAGPPAYYIILLYYTILCDSIISCYHIM